MNKKRFIFKSITIGVAALCIWGGALSPLSAAQIDSSTNVPKQNTVKKSGELTNTNPTKSTNWSKIKDLFL